MSIEITEEKPGGRVTKIRATGPGYEIELMKGQPPRIRINHSIAGPGNVQRDGDTETFEIVQKAD
jgi:hypothetical protein